MATPQPSLALHSFRSAISTTTNGPCGGRSRYCGYFAHRSSSARTSRSTTRAPASQPHPPQARPVLVPVVDHDLDARVRRDVRQPTQPPRPLRLLVDGRVERVALEREADRDDVRGPVRSDRGQPCDPLSRPVSHPPGAGTGRALPSARRPVAPCRPPGAGSLPALRARRRSGGEDAPRAGPAAGAASRPCSPRERVPRASSSSGSDPRWSTMIAYWPPQRRIVEHDGLDLTREHVHPAHDQHVVDTTVEACDAAVRPPTGARLVDEARDVPGPVAEHRQGLLRQRRQHELAPLPRRHRHAVSGSTISGRKWSSKRCSAPFPSWHSIATPGPITSDRP